MFFGVIYPLNRIILLIAGRARPTERNAKQLSTIARYMKDAKPLASLTEAERYNLARAGESFSDDFVLADVSSRSPRKICIIILQAWRFLDQSNPTIFCIDLKTKAPLRSATQ